MWSNFGTRMNGIWQGTFGHYTLGYWEQYLGILGTEPWDIWHGILWYLARYLGIMGTIPLDIGHNAFGYWAIYLGILEVEVTLQVALQERIDSHQRLQDRHTRKILHRIRRIAHPVQPHPPGKIEHSNDIGTFKSRSLKQLSTLSLSILESLSVVENSVT